MVNANIIISVSAVLVALILTIVVIMRVDGDPEDNFSVTVTGSYVHPDGQTFGADMYYCTGADCQFHEVTDIESFPGYYAPVGFDDFTDGVRSTFVTEHSIGKTFQFTDNFLVSCDDAEVMDTFLLAQRVAHLTAGFETGDKTLSMDLGDGQATFTIATYEMNPTPATDSPSVRGHRIPELALCKAIWAAEEAANCPAEEDNGDGEEVLAGGCGGSTVVPEDGDIDENAEVEDLTGFREDEGDAEEGGGRRRKETLVWQMATQPAHEWPYCVPTC